MSARSFTARFTAMLGIIGSAIAVSAAAREHRKPHDADLKRLGIDPDQFHRIRRY